MMTVGIIAFAVISGSIGFACGIIYTSAANWRQGYDAGWEGAEYCNEDEFQQCTGTFFCPHRNSTVRPFGSGHE